VDFSLAYSAASGRMGGTVPLALGLLSNQIALTGSVAMSAQYRTVFNQSETVSDVEWQSLLNQAYSYSSANATGNLALKVTPFAGSRLWSRSTASYSINLLLYQLVYSGIEVAGVPEYDSKWIEWDSEEYIRSHQVQLNAALDVLSGQALRLTADIWPRTLRFTGQVDLGLSPLSVSVASGIVQEDDKTWTLQPVTSAQALVFGDLGQIQNQISYDIDQTEVTYNRSSLVVGPVRANLDMRTTEGFDFGGAGVGWVVNSDRRFRPTQAEVSTSLSREFEPLWRNRLQLAGSLSSGWSMNLLRYTDSSFTFGLNANVEVTDFLRLSFSSQSVNTQSYVYLGPLAEGVGRERRSLALDFLKSFNFFNRQDRVESAFNLQQITVDATHYLEDWDLHVTYSGRPEIVLVLDEDTGGTLRQYDWQSSLDIELQWRAIRELSSNIGADNQTGAETVTTGSTWDLTFGSDS
jgi:hypothetical protein